MAKEKKWYSPYCDKPRIKHYYPISKLLRKLINAVRCRKLKVEYTDGLPVGATLICPNHACDFGPLAMDKVHRRRHRVWSVDTVIRMCTIPKHLLDNVLIVKNKFLRALCYPICCLVAPVMSCFIRSQEPIPVYHDGRLLDTFQKTVDTLNEGYDVVLYPEWKDKAEGYKYVNTVKSGVVFAAKAYIDKYKKPVNIVPVYVCESLKKVVYGRALVISEIENFKRDAREICRYIMDEIEGLAQGLPPHEITPYDATYRENACNVRAKVKA